MPKIKQLPFSTPFGTAVFPYLNTPDRKFQGDLDPGVFKVDLAVDPRDPEVKAFLKQVEDYRDAGAKAEGYTQLATLPWKDETDSDGKPTGRILIRFKQKEWLIQDKVKVPMRVRLVDSQKRPLDAPIGAGTTLRVAGRMRGWNSSKGYGVTLHLAACQILDLIEGVQDASDAFGIVPNGYVGDDSAADSITSSDGDF